MSKSFQILSPISDSSVLQLFSSFYITASQIYTLFMQRNQCKIVLKLIVMECQASFYKMNLISKLILFVSDYKNVEHIEKDVWNASTRMIERRKKKMTWLCVNLTKHVIYSRLELVSKLYTWLLKLTRIECIFLIQKEMLRFDRVSNLCRVEALRFVFV